MKAATQAATERLGSLASDIWKPIQKHLTGVQNVILSPDGLLWLAPWNALPINADGNYLIEKVSLRYVVSGRNLVTVTDDRATTAPAILANPRFDQKSGEKKASIQAIFKELPPVDDLTTRGFSAKELLPKAAPLPNTAIEAVAIKPHIESYTGQTATVYDDRYALERVVKTLSNPSLVSFATHGFFLETQTTEPDTETVENQGTRAAAFDSGGHRMENPLLRSGLLLAGCNNRDAVVGDDDGILTGLEIVGLDLRGTELVVLSACETGLGDIRNGEGVAGLRQAFQLAGAEAVLATLWQIPDRESAILMSSFFKHLAAGQSKAEALRSAQIELIEKRRARYGAAHPFYWAAFTVTGK